MHGWRSLMGMALALAGPGLGGEGAGATPAVTAPSAIPQCSAPSHDRLVIRKGRDVCGGTLGSRGQPVASGYLPTGCASEVQIYRIDANGWADRCLRRASNQGER